MDSSRSFACVEQPFLNTEPPQSGSSAAELFDCVELFAGCGAMALGLGRAGFAHTCMVELNPQACLTLRDNFASEIGLGYPSILERDIRDIDWTSFQGSSLVAGGPPCQPFSNGGLSAGKYDPRDMWPEAIRAVREIQPKAFVFENVKGLRRKTFSEYLRSIVNSLERGGDIDPDAVKQYQVAVVPVNAADFGAAQTRERVLIAGVRRDVGQLTSFPRPTHSLQRLVWDKWCTGEYWKRHGLERPDPSTMSRAERAALKGVLRSSVEPEGLPWQTCRDAFFELGEPGASSCVQGHEWRGVAKRYPGHSGSAWDLPAKALKAGVHGVPGGENMVVNSEGSARYFTVREACRLQGLPDSFLPSGSWSQAMRQLGNAVPAQLAEIAGRWIAKTLRGRRASQ
jgi:DNA (cytosine-5)-methyltransferase 1